MRLRARRLVVDSNSTLRMAATLSGEGTLTQPRPAIAVVGGLDHLKQ
jgi:hypothetical protein